MKEYPTARDASLSLWQSAVAWVTRERSAAGPRADRKPEKNTDGKAPAVDMDDPLNAATGAYIEASNAETDQQAVEKLRAVSGDKSPEASALFHKLAEARATGNQVLESSLKKAVKNTPDMTEEEETLWEEVAQRFTDLVSFFKHPLYRSWEKEGNGDINYSTIEWRLPSTGTVAILGDWGTGTCDAIEVLKQAAALNPDAIIHLGDIYMTGTSDECQDNFLVPMRRHAVDSETGRRIPVYNLAGNHDYYSGGHGYHWLIDHLNEGEQRQTASYFCLRSEDDGWQFVAMDTGYKSRGDITLAHSMGSVPREDEVPWIRHKLGSFGGRTILLTHHQAFSNHDRLGGDPDEPAGKDSINQRLIDIAHPHLDTVAGWFWGHEHNFVLFKEFLGVRAGRCVGHGAKPVTPRDFPDLATPHIETEEVKLSLSLDRRHLNHGFELIQLNGAGKPVDVIYYEVMLNEEGDGSVMREMYAEELW